MEILRCLWRTILVNKEIIIILAGIATILALTFTLWRKIMNFYTWCKTVKDNKICDKLIEKMNEVRLEPGFQNGKLTDLLSRYYPKMDRRRKERIFKLLDDLNEISIGPFGEYWFYIGKISRKKPENNNPYGRNYPYK